MSSLIYSSFEINDGIISNYLAKSLRGEEIRTLSVDSWGLECSIPLCKCKFEVAFWLKCQSYNFLQVLLHLRKTRTLCVDKVAFWSRCQSYNFFEQNNFLLNFTHLTGMYQAIRF